CSLGIETDVTDFHFAGTCAMVNLPVDDQASADSTAEGDVEDSAPPAASAVQRFTEGGDICIVVDCNRQSGAVAQPRGNREIAPARYMMDFHDLPFASEN